MIGHLAAPHESAAGRYCCKSRKSSGDNFPAKGRRDRRPSISVLSIALPRSPVSLPSGDEVPPHLYTEVASTAQRIFDQRCKKAFATISATSRHLLNFAFFEAA